MSTIPNLTDKDAAAEYRRLDAEEERLKKSWSTTPMTQFDWLEIVKVRDAKLAIAGKIFTTTGIGA